ELFTRHPGGRRPVELTEAGRVLLGHARAQLARVQATRADLAALSSGEQGRVRVATIQSIGARILPAPLARYRVTRPLVEVEIREMTTLEQLGYAVETGAVDIGFTVLPIGDGPFEVRHLFADPYVLVTRADRRERHLRDLDHKRVLGIRGCRHERLVAERLLAEGILPSSCERFDDNGMIQALGAAGEGVAVVPLLTVDPDDQRVTVHPLPDLPPRRLAAIIHRERRLGASVLEFLDSVVDTCDRATAVSRKRSGDQSVPSITPPATSKTSMVDGPTMNPVASIRSTVSL